VGHVRSDAESSRGIFRIGDDDIDRLGLADVSQMVGDDRATGVAEDVADEEKFQRTPAVCFEVMAPSDAEPTSAMYLPKTPLVYRGAGAFQFFSRRAISSAGTSRLRVPASTSISMVSPSSTAAMGPPATASGAIWAIMKPCVAPLKR